MARRIKDEEEFTTAVEQRTSSAPVVEAKEPEVKPASGYVYRLQGRHGRSGGKSIQYLPGESVEGLSANEILHFLANGIIEPRKG